MIKKILLFTIFAGLMFSGCGYFDCCFPTVIKVNPTSVTLEPAAANTEDADVITNLSWAVADKPDWITVYPNNGNGATSVSITADVNSTGNERKGVVTFMAANGDKAKLNVTQTDDTTPPALIEVTTIGVTPDPASVTVGSTVTLTANVIPANASDNTVLWSSSDGTVATVSPAGVVTGVSDGSVTITATANDGSGVSGSASVTVTAVTTVTYTVTFNSNGGSAVTSQTVNDGGNATEPTAPTKTDHIFAGWFEDDGTFASPVTFPFTVTGDITFYAKWTAVVAPTYLIDEDFEGFAAGTTALTAGWLQQYAGTSASVMNSESNNYLRLRGTNTNHCQYYQNLPVVLPDIITVEADMRPNGSISTDTGGFALGDKLLYSWGACVARVSFENGNINTYYNNNSPVTMYTLGTFTVGQWYHIKMVCNILAETYQVYVDGTLMDAGGVSTFPMMPGVLPKEFLLVSGNSMDFDNIKMYY